MNGRSESFSDIDRARELSRRLSGMLEPSSPAATPEPDGTCYTRFPRSTPLAGPEPTPQRATPQAAAPADLTTWERFLTWSLLLSGGRAAFVVDSQGFVIASSGNVPADGFEGIGAELCLAMDQLNRADPDAGNLVTIELQFQNRRVVGLQALAETQEPFILGFVLAKSLSDETREVLLRQLLAAISALA